MEPRVKLKLSYLSLWRSHYSLCAFNVLGTYPEVKQKLVWRGKQCQKERTWVKVQIALPADLDEYRVLLHGKVNKSLYNHSVNYLSIDNLELLGCSKRKWPSTVLDATKIVKRQIMMTFRKRTVIMMTMKEKQLQDTCFTQRSSLKYDILFLGIITAQKFLKKHPVSTKRRLQTADRVQNAD